MDGKIDTVREALERGLDKERQKKYSDAMECMTTHRWYWQWAQDLESNCKEALAALSASDPESIRREKDAEIAALKESNQGLITIMKSYSAEIAALKAERDRLREAILSAHYEIKKREHSLGFPLDEGIILREAFASSPAEAEPERGPEVATYSESDIWDAF